MGNLTLINMWVPAFTTLFQERKGRVGIIYQGKPSIRRDRSFLKIGTLHLFLQILQKTNYN